MGTHKPRYWPTVEHAKNQHPIIRTALAPVRLEHSQPWVEIGAS